MAESVFECIIIVCCLKYVYLNITGNQKDWRIYLCKKENGGDLK